MPLLNFSECLNYLLVTRALVLEVTVGGNGQSDRVATLPENGLVPLHRLCNDRTLNYAATKV